MQFEFYFNLNLGYTPKNYKFLPFNCYSLSASFFILAYSLTFIIFLINFLILVFLKMLAIIKLKIF